MFVVQKLNRERSNAQTIQICRKPNTDLSQAADTVKALKPLIIYVLTSSSVMFLGLVPVCVSFCLTQRDDENPFVRPH